MGLYSKHVLPCLLDLAMRNPEAARLRADSVPQARGVVLEVGIGSGLNLPFYTPGVRRVYGVDPSAELQRMARSRASGCPFDVELLTQSAEDALPLPDASIDSAVVTWSLCSIPDPIAALRQVRRVMKKDAILIFVEHGRSPTPSVAGLQDRLTPVWRMIAGGCHLTRKIDTLIETSFRVADLKNFYVPGPRPMTYMYQGCARPK